MAIFDEMRHLTKYLYDSHMQKKHHLSDLYELVQYAGSIIPRLYLMITVGSVFMKVSTELLPDNPETQTDAVAGGEGDNNILQNENDSLQEKTIHDKFEEDIPPVKELMKDMLEMTRGVQHPTRGLFLRYYLSVMTRDYMPFGKGESFFFFFKKKKLFFIYLNNSIKKNAN